MGDSMRHISSKPRLSPRGAPPDRRAL